MKVLHLASGGEFCGIATYTTNLMIHFKEKSCHTFFEIPPKDELSRLSKKDILSFFDKFIEASREYDVVHIQNEYGLFCGPERLSFGLEVFYGILIGLKKLSKKCFTTFHSEPVFLQALGLLNFENRKCARLWHKICKLFTAKNDIWGICHTSISQNKFLRSGMKNIHVITHGVIERKIDHRRSLKRKDDSIVLSLFGFIAPYKGHHLALAVMDLLPPNFKLSIIGGRHPNSEGDEIGETLKQANDLGLSKRVLVTGWVSPQEADYYQQNCDICLAPYQATELSASGAITWSLTSGKPVIASNINSFKSINRDHNCMVLCNKSDRVEWVWAIKKVAEDSSLRKRLVDNASKYCQDNSWTNICKQHMELYNE